jgi:hypothetical protein
MAMQDSSPVTKWYILLVLADFTAVCLSFLCPCMFFTVLIASFWLLVITPMGYLVTFAAKSSDRHDLLRLSLCYFMFVAFNLIKPFLYEQQTDECQTSTLRIESWAIGIANIGLPVSLLTEWHQAAPKKNTATSSATSATPQNAKAEV